MILATTLFLMERKQLVNGLVLYDDKHNMNFM